jgi:hypothetical protein
VSYYVPIVVEKSGRGERSAEQEQFEATYQAFNLPTDFVLSKFQEEDGDFEYHN